MVVSKMQPFYTFVRSNLIPYLEAQQTSLSGSSDNSWFYDNVKTLPDKEAITEILKTAPETGTTAFVKEAINTISTLDRAIYSRNKGSLHFHLANALRQEGVKASLLHKVGTFERNINEL